MFSIIVLTSGKGGLLEAILQHATETDGYKVVKVLSDRLCRALDLSDKYQIRNDVLPSTSVHNYLEHIPRDIDLIVLAGYLRIIPSHVCEAFRERIINIHPSLLPKFSGKGMFGIRVHEAVLEAKEKITGCSVHFVTKELDAGPIIAQRSLEIPPGISPWILGSQVHRLEKELLTETILKFSQGELIP